MHVNEIIEHEDGSATYQMTLTKEEVQLLLSDAIFRAIKAAADAEVKRVEDIEHPADKHRYSDLVYMLSEELTAQRELNDALREALLARP